MSDHWIHRVLGRQAKINRSRHFRKQRKRRLLLQGLESRQLLAGDMMAMDHSMSTGHSGGHGDPLAMIASNDPSSSMSHSAVTSGMMANSTMTDMSGHSNHMAHPAAMALVSADQSTHTVAASGNWSDPSIWENNAVPTAGARIVIPQGLTLTVDSEMTTEFKTIGIHGTLRFATDVNTELRVDTIVSAPHGRFEMGTAANPIANDVTAKLVFADDGVIDTTWDPEQLSRGALLHGTTVIHGAESTHRATLESFPAAGETSIQLSVVPENWKAGDEIVITGTQGATSDEVRTIDSINGSTVNFVDPLALDHIPPESDLNVYVANKTRNVQISSENASVAHRGHIMLMHTLDVDIQNAQLKDLGRTDKTRPLDDIFFEFPDVVGNETSAPVVFNTETGPRTNVRGRYALHFHRGGVDPNSTPALVSGSVVDGSPGWGFVNHSANVNMVNNVAYNVQGTAFYTEVGDEIGSMVGNIAIRSVNPTFTLDDEGAIDPDLGLDRMDFGNDGDGFWLSGHMVSMRDNVAAGASAHGIIIWSDGVIEPDLARGRSSVQVANVANGNLITGRDTIPTWWAPLADIQNNESYGATVGFRSRYVHSAGYLGEIGSDFHAPPDQAYIDTLNPTIDGLTVWGSRDGMLMNYNERMSIRNARLVGTGAPYVQNGGTADTGVGLDMYNEVTRGPGVIENVTIEGFNMGFLAPR
ncbi:MAG: G8 domain-containing protein, partial [Planctomycetota bacterium]